MTDDSILEHIAEPESPAGPAVLEPTPVSYAAGVGSRRWTAARVEILRALYEVGLPFSQIAAELGGVTRNAAIGKANRLGLFRVRPAPKHPKRKGGSYYAQLRGEKAPSRKPTPPMPLPPEEKIVVSAIGIFELEPRHCRFPVGEAVGCDQLFCGSPRVNSWPYCSGHARKAFAG